MTRDQQSVPSSRRLSRFRGVTKTDDGTWHAYVSSLERFGCADLGTFASKQEAARACDMASVALKREAAETHFPLTDYLDPETGRFKKDIPWYVPALIISFLKAAERYRALKAAKEDPVD